MLFWHEKHIFKGSSLKLICINGEREQGEILLAEEAPHEELHNQLIVSLTSATPCLNPVFERPRRLRRAVVTHDLVFVAASFPFRAPERKQDHFIHLQRAAASRYVWRAYINGCEACLDTHAV